MNHGWYKLYHHTGGPLSDVLLEREKQRRTTDKKHSPEKHKVSLIPRPQSKHTFVHYNHSLIPKFSGYTYECCMCTLSSCQLGALENVQLFNQIHMTLLFRKKRLGRRKFQNILETCTHHPLSGVHSLSGKSLRTILNTQYAKNTCTRP